MTADRRAALVAKVADAIAKAWDEHGRVIDAATAAIDLIRAEVLEEAARVADDERWNTACLTSLPLQSSAAFNIAAAIRELKEAPCSSS